MYPSVLAEKRVREAAKKACILRIPFVVIVILLVPLWVFFSDRIEAQTVICSGNFVIFEPTPIDPATFTFLDDTTYILPPALDAYHYVSCPDPEIYNSAGDLVDVDDLSSGGSSGGSGSSVDLLDLTDVEIGQLSSAVLVLFTIAFVFRFIRKHIDART